MDAEATQRFLKAFDYGVELEHLAERFGISRSQVYATLQEHGRKPEPLYPQTIHTGSRPRTGRYSVA